MLWNTWMIERHLQKLHILERAERHCQHDQRQQSPYGFWHLLVRHVHFRREGCSPSVSISACLKVVRCVTNSDTTYVIGGVWVNLELIDLYRTRLYLLSLCTRLVSLLELGRALWRVLCVKGMERTRSSSTKTLLIVGKKNNSTVLVNNNIHVRISAFGNNGPKVLLQFTL